MPKSVKPQNASKFFNLVVGLFILSTFVSGAVFIGTERENNSSAASVNIAGRNRMISQRAVLLLSKEFDQPGSSADEIITLLGDHRENLDILQYGGKIEVDGGESTVEVPPARDDVLSALKDARSMWDGYEAGILIALEDIVLYEGEEDQLNLIDQQIKQLVAESTQMLALNHAVVLRLVEDFSESRARAATLIRLVTVLNILILLATIPFVRRPLKRIEAASKEREAAFERIEKQGTELTTQAKDLLSQKEAMVNLLEDLELEREKLRKNQRELSEAQKIGKIGSCVWNLRDGGGVWSEESYKLHNLEVQAGTVPFAFEEYASLVHEDDLAAVRKEMERAMTADTAELTYRLNLPEGELRWIRARSKLERDEDGNPYKLKGTFQDVTQEHQIDQAKSEFVSLASHQLRTPLSSINWYTEMLLAGDAGEISEQQTEFLHEIEASSKRMVDLVNALLNVSRLELGTFMVQPTELMITDLADQVLKELQPMIKQRKQTVNVQYDDDLPTMMVDSKLMTIVFQNLLSNAVKYTPEGGEITLTVKKDEGTMQITVSDTGMGIPESQQEKIFSKLFRADNVRAKDTEGTGLGLYIVKAILDEAGGSVKFQSEENKGTTFYVTMPLSGMIQKEGSRELN